LYSTEYGAIKEVLNSINGNHPSIREISHAVITIRQSKLPDPAEIGNAGSFFKNPVIDLVDYEGLRAEFASIPGYKVDEKSIKVPAAWMIEQCGWKGKRIGNIGVHDKQALVLVNHRGGKGSDIWKLAVDIQASVADTFGIELQ
jgi:UDP-N-acetylmuramate dehydrogenase